MVARGDAQLLREVSTRLASGRELYGIRNYATRESIEGYWGFEFDRLLENVVENKTALDALARGKTLPPAGA